MVGIGLGDRQKDRSAVWVGQVGIGRRYAVAGDDCGAIFDPRIVDVEIAIGWVLWMEGQSQQAPLATRHNQGRHIQEGDRQRGAILDHLNAPGLFYDKEPARPVSGMGHLHRLLKAGGNHGIDGDLHIGQLLRRAFSGQARRCWGGRVQDKRPTESQ